MIATRADDEQVLRWIAMRKRGVAPLDIETSEGLSLRRVSVATNRVRLADIEESGEPHSEVSKHYWCTQ